MALGELTLYEKRGIFYQGSIVETGDPEREVKMVSDPVFLTGFNEGDDLGVTDTDRHHSIIPLEVDGSTEYITGAYRDAGNIDGAYTVKLWLLVEEKPISVQGR